MASICAGITHHYGKQYLLDRAARGPLVQTTVHGMGFINVLNEQRGDKVSCGEI